MKFFKIIICSTAYFAYFGHVISCMVRGLLQEVKSNNKPSHNNSHRQQDTDSNQNMLPCHPLLLTITRRLGDLRVEVNHMNQ